MAIIGCLGEIIFTVSSDVVETLDNMQWSGKTRYSTHQRHLQNALTEFTGIDTDTISFNITLSRQFGVDPQVEIAKIWKYEREGTPVPLTIGEKAYGKYRWSITDHKAKINYFDINGNVMVATVSLNLLEYLKR